MKKISGIFLASLFLAHTALAESAVSSPENPATVDASSGFEIKSTTSGTDTISLTPAKEKEKTVTPIALGQGMQITAITRHEEDAALAYTIDYSYPQITGNNISTAATRFNDLVKADVTETLQKFKNYVKADMPHMQALPDSLKHNSLNIDYTVNVLKPGKMILISVRLATEGMQAGRAHPYHNHQTINFNLTTGKKLALRDLFKPRIKYLNNFAKYSSNELNKKLEDKWMIGEGTAPLAKNYENWNLTSQGIQVTFEEYQVAPYVYGPQTVVIPYSALKNDIAHNSSLAICTTAATNCGA